MLDTYIDICDYYTTENKSDRVNYYLKIKTVFISLPSVCYLTVIYYLHSSLQSSPVCVHNIDICLYWTSFDLTVIVLIVNSK
jgi:hypothetical protein